MRTSTDNHLTYICLERSPNFYGRECFDYEEAYKLNWEQYEKVMLAKAQRGLLNYVNVLPDSQFPLNKPFPVRDLQVGDFVYAKGRTDNNYSKPVFGWIKEDENGRLYIHSYKLSIWSGLKQKKLFPTLKALFNSVVLLGANRKPHYEFKAFDDHSFSPEKFYLFKPDGTPSAAFRDLTIVWKKNTIQLQKSAA